MRDFRDAKAMACALRDALKAKAIETKPKPSHERRLSVPRKSIEYAVMERTEHAAVLPVSVRWSDIGNWKSVWDGDKVYLRGQSVDIAQGAVSTGNKGAGDLWHRVGLCVPRDARAAPHSR